MKLRILKIITVITIIGALVYFNGGFNSLINPQTAYAVGDLTVNWGVPEGDPIFVVSDFAPGESETRVVNVANGASSPRPVGVRGTLDSQTNNLSSVLDFVVKDGGTDVYGGTSGTGPKTLEQFFNESATVSGIPLSTIPNGGNTNYSFVATFQSSAGNDFQNSNITFDLIIGVFFDLPSVCEGITFSGSPKFGTSGNDNINGGNGNDLIISFEGNDNVNGGNGQDCILGGNGNNNLRGGNAADVIVSGNGNNNIDGGNGSDNIVAGNGTNNVSGGNGNDQITTGSGNDQISGGNGNDQISSGGGNDAIDCGNGSDVVDAGGGNDLMRGGNGNDSLTGGDGSDQAQGNNGTDTCSAEVETTCEL